MARRKKSSGATFLVAHKADKPSKGKATAESLGLRLPVYHEKGIKYDDEKFGEFLAGGESPKVMIIDEKGVLVFQGIMDRDFDKALRAATSRKK